MRWRSTWGLETCTWPTDTRPGVQLEENRATLGVTPKGTTETREFLETGVQIKVGHAGLRRDKPLAFLRAPGPAASRLQSSQAAWQSWSQTPGHFHNALQTNRGLFPPPFPRRITQVTALLTSPQVTGAREAAAPVNTPRQQRSPTLLAPPPPLSPLAPLARCPPLPSPSAPPLGTGGAPPSSSASRAMRPGDALRTGARQSAWAEGLGSLLRAPLPETEDAGLAGQWAGRLIRRKGLHPELRKFRAHLMWILIYSISSLCLKAIELWEGDEKLWKVKVKPLSRVRLFATPRTVAYQAPPSMGFSRRECWSGLPFPSPGGLPDPGIEPGSPAL